MSIAAFGDIGRPEILTFIFSFVGFATGTLFFALVVFSIMLIEKMKFKIKIEKRGDTLAQFSTGYMVSLEGIGSNLEHSIKQLQKFAIAMACLCGAAYASTIAGQAVLIKMRVYEASFLEEVGIFGSVVIGVVFAKYIWPYDLQVTVKERTKV